MKFPYISQWCLFLMPFDDFCVKKNVVLKVTYNKSYTILNCQVFILELMKPINKSINMTFLWMNTVILRTFYGADVLDIGQLDG